MLCSFISCKKLDIKGSGHPEYFDSVFSQTERISYANTEKAILYLDSAFGKYPDPGLRDLYRKYSFKTAYFIQASPKDPMAMRYSDSMLWVLRNHRNDKEYLEYYGNAYIKRSDLLMARNDFAGAFEANYKAREAMEETHDTCLLSAYTFMLSTVCYKQEKFLDAAHYNQEALKEYSHCKNDYNKFRTTQAKLDDIGLAYEKCNIYDSAMLFFNKALNYIDLYKDSFRGIGKSDIFIEEANGVVYGNIGDIYLKTGDTAKAELFYKKDLALNGKKDHDPGDLQCTQLKIVNLYLNRNKFEDARLALSAMRASLDSFDDLHNELKWYRLQLDLLNKTGHNEEAYKYIKPYIKLEDSVANLARIPQVDIANEYRHLKDQYDLDNLSKENELKTHFLIIELAFVIIALIVAYLLYHYWKRSKKMNDMVRKQNNEMKLTLNSLTESQKENTQMMQIVAHDLRNPIASMISITSLLLDNKDLPADDREMMELMQQSSTHAYNMIDDLLNINMAAETVERGPVDMHMLLRYCVDLLQYKASEKGQHIYLTSDEATININREKIWRVISNLIVNAIKFSEKGKEIEITGTKGQKDFTIEFRDHGIGIPDSIKYRIFTMFTNAKRPGTDGERSFGMGLAISRQIVESYGGKIWFESEENAGTSFFISLPLS